MRRVVCLFALAAASGLPQDIFHKAPPEVEDALRKRILEFYSLYQQGKFRQAEELVAKESRDYYYNMNKAPIRSFQLEQITFESGFETASVLVACLSAHPRTASQGIWIPVPSKWKLEHGDWFLVIKPRTTTPFGPMMFSDPRESKPQPFIRPTPEMLRSKGFSVEPTKLSFPKDAEGPVERTVTITNNIPGILHLFLDGPKLPGVTASLSDKLLQPNSSATLKVVYDRTAGKLTGAKELQFTIQPLNHTVAIALDFEQ